MSQLIAHKPGGNTVAINVSAVNVSSTFVSAFAGMNDNVNFAAFLNVGAVPVAISMAPNGEAPNAAFPAQGASAPVIVLPANMNWPVTYAVPMGNANQFSLKAIANSSISPTIFITPVVSL